jgi:hypothetical protein
MGSVARLVRAPTQCVCKAPGEEGLGGADAPRPLREAGRGPWRNCFAGVSDSHQPLARAPTSGADALTRNGSPVACCGSSPTSGSRHLIEVEAIAAIDG